MCGLCTFFGLNTASIGIRLAMLHALDTVHRTVALPNKSHATRQMLDVIYTVSLKHVPPTIAGADCNQWFLFIIPYRQNTHRFYNVLVNECQVGL